MLEVRTPAARPYVVSLARLISSSMLENLTTTMMMMMMIPSD